MRRAILAVLVLALGACDEPDRWRTVFEGLPGALISVWGTSARDVWTVGGDAGDGSGPMVLHFDGEGWQRRPTGVGGDLWWVHGFDGGPVFAGGKDGHILRWNGDAFEAMQTPGTNTVFGIWGVAPDDLWAVGGDGSGSGFVWRYDGTAWKAADGFPARALAASLFKVWGRARDDVWIVGTSGVTVHWDGQAFTDVTSGTTRTLFTVHGTPTRAAAVGGFGSGVVLEHDGSAWRDVTPPGAKQAIGVCLVGDGGWAVGSNGSVLRRDAAGWTEEPTGLDIYRDLHAVWVDPDGGVWAVGGQVVAFPLIDGVLLHRGKAVAGGSYR